ncbi:MAG: hypothetical protein ACLQBB_04675 [Solirubrobacteraceae bacterium]
MQARPIFPGTGTGAGMYESFYLRAFSPTQPLGIWIRHTVHKRPGQPPRGSIWCTVFDPRQDAPFMCKVSSELLESPPGGWIAIDDLASFGPRGAQGSCGAARWSLRFDSLEPPLRHLRPGLLYRTPLPRTKLTSPAPAASFDGVLELAGREPIELCGWPGMIGHNWGSEHAERWIWLSGLGFEQAPDAWLDLALGRLAVAGRLTPWVANGAISIGGRRHHLGGLRARPRVRESAEGCVVELGGARGPSIALSARVPAGSAAGWRYADPDGGEHDVVNCSIAALQLTARLPGDASPRPLHTSHGGAYELGMRERDHGVPIAPFADG